MWVKSLTTVTVLGLGATSAFAGNHNAYGHRAHYRASPTEYVYARVVDVDPMVRYVTVNRPHEECYTDYERQRTGQFGVPGQTAAGAVIGAAIGRQFGGGSGKDLATLAGAVAGGAIRGITKATPFSSQSVITSAKADGEAPPITAAAMSILRILAGIMRSFPMGNPRTRMLPRRCRAACPQ